MRIAVLDATTPFSAAVAAPSIHNTQPRRFRPDPDALTLDIRAATRRGLLVLRLVKSFSGPPEPGSRYEGPGPAAPIQPASACGGVVWPRCWRL